MGKVSLPVKFSLSCSHSLSAMLLVTGIMGSGTRVDTELLLLPPPQPENAIENAESPKKRRRSMLAIPLFFNKTVIACLE